MLLGGVKLRVATYEKPVTSGVLQGPSQSNIQFHFLDYPQSSRSMDSNIIKEPITSKMTTQSFPCYFSMVSHLFSPFFTQLLLPSPPLHLSSTPWPQGTLSDLPVQTKIPYHWFSAHHCSLLLAFITCIFPFVGDYFLDVSLFTTRSQAPEEHGHLCSCLYPYHWPESLALSRSSKFSPLLLDRKPLQPQPQADSLAMCSQSSCDPEFSPSKAKSIPYSPLQSTFSES